jgi:hypothetical protein
MAESSVETSELAPGGVACLRVLRIAATVTASQAATTAPTNSAAACVQTRRWFLPDFTRNTRKIRQKPDSRRTAEDVLGVIHS